jgi:hypothetical protein
VLAPARPLAREQRQHDAEGSVQARARVVGDEIERNDRLLAAGLADQVQDAGQRQVVHVVRGVVLVGSVLSEARQRAVHQARVQLAQRLVSCSEPVHHAGAEALDHDVGAGGEPAEDRLALGRLHVEGHRALVPVDEGVDRAADRQLVGRPLGLWRLDLQHVGAHVGHEHARHLSRRHPGQLQHFDPVERPHG